MSDDKTTTRPNLRTGEQVCGTCEYFDYGTMGEDGHSDCLNRLSPRFQTYVTQTCVHWTQST